MEFIKLDSYIVEKILKYVELEDYKRLILVNKYFYNTIKGLINDEIFFDYVKYRLYRREINKVSMVNYLNCWPNLINLEDKYKEKILVPEFKVFYGELTEIERMLWRKFYKVEYDEELYEKITASEYIFKVLYNRLMIKTPEIIDICSIKWRAYLSNKDNLNHLLQLMKLEDFDDIVEQIKYYERFLLRFKSYKIFI